MKLISIFLLFLLTACATTNTKKALEEKIPLTTSELLDVSYQQLVTHQYPLALQTLLKAKQECDEKNAANENKIFIARTPDERFFYLLQASFEQVATSVEMSPCADISYLIGYSYLELGDVDNAQKHIMQAVEFSPVNAAYLSELAYIYQLKGDIQNALSTFLQAEENAENFTPKHLKKEELGRAKRGIGYNLIELGRLDDAVVKFNECLELAPNDTNAKAELNYITSLSKQIPKFNSK